MQKSKIKITTFICVRFFSFASFLKTKLGANETKPAETLSPGVLKEHKNTRTNLFFKNNQLLE